MVEAKSPENPHVGSSLEDFFEELGELQEVQRRAALAAEVHMETWAEVKE
jgi:hypothetical protein